MSDLGLLAVALGAAGGAALWLATTRTTMQRPTLWYELRWPRELQVESVVAFLRTLAADHRRHVIALEVVVGDGRLQHRLGLADRHAGQVLAALRAQASGLTASIIEQDAARAPVFARKLRLSGAEHSLRTADPEQVARALLTALATTDRRDTVVLQWLLGPRLSPGADQRSDSWGALLKQSLLPAKPTQPDAQELRARREKTAEAGFRAVCRIGVASGLEAAARATTSQILAAMRTAEAPGVRLHLTRESVNAIAAASLPRDWSLALNVRELAELIAWPLGDRPYAGLERAAARLLAPSERVPSAGRIVAQSIYPGAERPLALSAQDALQHLHVMSPTGTGKSTLLLNLAARDIADGRTVVVLDPKGDLIEALAERIPAERLDDVVLVDPADEQRPVGLNVLAGGGRSPELIADVVLHAFHSLYKDAWGPRTQDILHASLLTLAGKPEMTLCALPVLLSNQQFRRRMVAQVSDEIALRPFWHWYDALGEAERQQAIAPVMNKLRSFLLRPRMRAVLGQSQPGFDLHRIFAEHKVVLVSLAKGVLGPEAASLLGALIIGEVWQATLGRVTLPLEQRHPAMLYIDEFQDYLYLPTDLSDVLAQARGLGLGVTLAHQAAAQVPRAMLSALLANARSRVCFQLGFEDARLIASSTTELEAADLQGLGRYEVYASLVAQGSVTPYASARTLTPPDPVSDAAAVRAHSRERYGRDLGAVEAELARLVGALPGVEESPVGRRRRT